MWAGSEPWRFPPKERGREYARSSRRPATPAPQAVARAPQVRLESPARVSADRRGRPRPLPTARRPEWAPIRRSSPSRARTENSRAEAPATLAPPTASTSRYWREKTPSRRGDNCDCAKPGTCARVGILPGGAPREVFLPKEPAPHARSSSLSLHGAKLSRWRAPCQATRLFALLHKFFLLGYPSSTRIPPT